MIIRKTLPVLIILSLILSGIPVAYCQEDTIGDQTTTEASMDVITSEGAVSDVIIPDEQETTDDAIKQVAGTDDKITVKATYNYYLKSMSTAGVLTQVGAAGYDTVALANAAMKTTYSSTGNKGLVVTDAKDKIINMISGIAIYNSNSSTVTIGNTYIPPSYAMHFYGVSGTNNVNTGVGISGAQATLATAKLMLIPETLIYPNSTNFYYRDYYTKNSSGDMVHYLYRVADPGTKTPYKSGTGKTSAAGSFVVDKAPAWMSLGARYYSPDGISFYSDPAMTVKTGSAYYPYYKFLPHRNMSAYTTAELNKWINYKTPSVAPVSTASKLTSQGRNFINAQNRYGINGLSELAFACLESAYGKSNYAVNRNNLFGINAVDSNPDNAFSFSSVRECINEHTNKHLSKGYGDVKSDSRYFGLTPGNKAVGVNVKYASDPWHGEKIAGIAYSIDKYLGSKDYRKFTVGLTNKNSVNVYKSAGSTLLYNLSTKGAGNGPTGIPVIILGSSGDHYRIQSELPVSGNAAGFNYTYNYGSSTAYVKKSDINVINNGTRNYTTQISQNRDLKNITVKVGSKNYLSGFDPGKTAYIVTIPNSAKSIAINGTKLMSTSTVTGNGTKTLSEQIKTYDINVKSASGTTKTYKVTVNWNGAKTLEFGVDNSKTKLSNLSKKGKKTTSLNPMKVQTSIKTNNKKTTVKMVIYNKNKKVVAQKVQYVEKSKTVKFKWNGKYTKHNKLNKKTGKYATRSKTGTKYYVQFIVSRNDTTTFKGRYHTFYLYK